jgi:hypothetical protein
MSSKTSPFSDPEIELLLNFVEANKTVLLDPSNIKAKVDEKNAKWDEIAGILSAKGIVRSRQSVIEKWHTLKKDAKREWDKAYVVKPTGGGKIREFNWKTKFIVETIGLQFHPPTKIAGGFDSSDCSLERDSETNGPSASSKDSYSNNEASSNSTEIFEEATPSTSPSSTSSKVAKKRIMRETTGESDEKSREAKYEEVLNTQLEVHRLEKYKLLLEIGLLKDF